LIVIAASSYYRQVKVKNGFGEISGPGADTVFRSLAQVTVPFVRMSDPVMAVT
jgi:hypothetical protein